MGKDSGRIYPTTISFPRFKCVRDGLLHRHGAALFHSCCEFSFAQHRAAACKIILKFCIVFLLPCANRVSDFFRRPIELHCARGLSCAVCCIGQTPYHGVSLPFTVEFLRNDQRLSQCYFSTHPVTLLYQEIANEALGGALKISIAKFIE